MVRTIYSFPEPKINNIFDDVYSPSEDSYLIIDYFRENIDENYFDGFELAKIRNILDMGTGTGVIAIFLQLIKMIVPKFSPQIFASDILENAIKCAISNENANNLENKIEFIQSDLFKTFPSILKNSFNILIFNPPYLPSFKFKNEGWDKKNTDYCWNGGKEGFEVFLEFIRDVKPFIDPNQKFYIYYISSSTTNLKKLNDNLNIQGFKNTILKKKHVFFEDIILNRLEKRND